MANTCSYVLSSPITPTLRESVRTANDCQSFRYQPAPVISRVTILSASRRRANFSGVTSPITRTAKPGEIRSEEHTSELQSRPHLVCRLLLEKKKKTKIQLINKKKKQKDI